MGGRRKGGKGGYRKIIWSSQLYSFYNKGYLDKAYKLVKLAYKHLLVYLRVW